MAIPGLEILGAAGLVLSLAACSSSPEKNEGKGAGSEAVATLPPGTVPDKFQAAETLKLATITPDETSQKNFDFTKVAEIVWTSSSEVLFAHGDGRSVAFDFKKSTWTSVHSNPGIGEFQTLFDFRESGFFGASPDVLSLKTGEGPIVRLKPSEAYLAAAPLASNPGFVAFLDGNVINVIASADGGAKLYSLTNAPAGVKLVYPCNQHCLFWAFNGTTLFTYNVKMGWTPLAQTIEFPAGETVVRVAIRLRESNNPLAVESILAQMESGAVYAQVAAAVAATDPTWEDIRRLSTIFCVSCHIDDGFEKESTWKSLKGNIVTRLKATAGTKGAMPPGETTLGKEMSQGEKNVILAWIERQDQIERGEIGTTKDPIEDNSDTTGELKILADSYCIACHNDAKKNLFWTTQKADAKARIESGNMPQNTSLSPAEKTRFLDLLTALK